MRKPFITSLLVGASIFATFGADKASAADYQCCLRSKDASGNDKATFVVGESIYFSYRLSKFVTAYTPQSGAKNVGWEFADGCSYNNDWTFTSYSPYTAYEYISTWKGSPSGCTAISWSPNWGGNPEVVVHSYTNPGTYQVYSALRTVGFEQLYYDPTSEWWRAYDTKTITVTAKPATGWLPAAVSPLLR
jgi:hypothetical protein